MGGVETDPIRQPSSTELGRHAPFDCGTNETCNNTLFGNVAEAIDTSNVVGRIVAVNPEIRWGAEIVPSANILTEERPACTRVMF